MTVSCVIHTEYEQSASKNRQLRNEACQDLLLWWAVIAYVKTYKYSAGVRGSPQLSVLYLTGRGQGKIICHWIRKLFFLNKTFVVVFDIVWGVCLFLFHIRSEVQMAKHLQLQLHWSSYRCFDYDYKMSLCVSACTKSPTLKKALCNFCTLMWIKTFIDLRSSVEHKLI